MTQEKAVEKTLNEKVTITKMADGYFYAERHSRRAKRWIFIGRRRNIPDLEKLLDKEAIRRITELRYAELVQFINWRLGPGAKYDARETRIICSFPDPRRFGWTRTPNGRSKIIEKR